MPNVKGPAPVTNATVSNTSGKIKTTATTAREWPHRDRDLGLEAVPKKMGPEAASDANCFEHERSTWDQCDHCARVAAGR